MSKVYLFTKGKYIEVENLNALIRHKGSLLVIEDSVILKHIELLLENNNNYMFIILNGNKKELIEKMISINLHTKPKRIFVISKETESLYFNDLPKLLPYIDHWDSKVADLFSKVKKETREFFDNCTCNVSFI